MLCTYEQEVVEGIERRGEKVRGITREVPSERIYLLLTSVLGGGRMTQQVGDEVAWTNKKKTHIGLVNYINFAGGPDAWDAAAPPRKVQPC